MDVANRVAVITGGATGMGYAAAQLLAAKGAKVALLARREAMAVEKGEALGGIGIGCDISDEAAVEAALSEVEARLGTATILINSAADGRLWNLVSPRGEPVSGGYIREILATNVAGMMYLARGFAVRIARAFPERRDEPYGVIINVSSISGADGGAGSAYCVSKGAVNAAALCFARELSPWGIRVVTVLPGGIDTELYRAGATEAVREQMRQFVPSPRRAGHPDEFARLALHICENDYLNATNIRLDGGFRIPFGGDVGGGYEMFEPS
jgi:NAD(P)-dependent dehydrogenase (short-subunit alcohol dehydrogenase family)